MFINLYDWAIQFATYSWHFGHCHYSMHRNAYEGKQFSLWEVGRKREKEKQTDRQTLRDRDKEKQRENVKVRVEDREITKKKNINGSTNTQQKFCDNNVCVCNGMVMWKLISNSVQTKTK